MSTVTSTYMSSLRGGLLRVLGIAVLAALVAPLLMTASASSAHAEDDERDNYSLYQLASNASTYFSQENAPGNDGPHENWDPITSNPATGGSLLGYADPEFSLGDVVGWFFAEVSGSSQTVTYETFRGTGSDEDPGTYSGMLDYAHFGAANADLGLDTMSSGVGGQIVSLIGGGIMWALYALALAVSTVFWLVIQLLKVMNPFMWFYQAVAGVADASGNPNSEHQQELADGMTGGDTGGGALTGLQHWIADWYGLLQSIAWEALVPLFIAFLLIGLILFKKMDRGSAIKKLIVRVVFIGVGLPLLGSMYTGVLDKFDDSLVGQHSGPTRVVLSTYVDFEAWMMNDRLGVPDEASISWDDGQAGPESTMSVRNSALAINKQSHGDTYADINISSKTDDAGESWRNGTVDPGDSAGDDVQAVFTTFGILNGYIGGREIAASDFESGIKTSITNLDEMPAFYSVLNGKSDAKEDWFVNKASYGDVEKFGEEKGPVPSQHPVIATGGMEGLTSSNPGGNTTTFTTAGTKSGCGFTVLDGEGDVASCNMSALSAYNYLNTGFGSASMTMYSSNKAMSGMTRESHMAVSQVGTGPAKFMYWSNAAIVLGSLVLLGFWYAIGMLAGAVKRTFSLVAAIPFATLGAVSAIAKVVVYSAALILEVVVSLFIYQFVSELLISIPDIIAGPVSALMAMDGIWGSGLLGGIVVVLLTLISSIVIAGVTFSLLKVRKVALQAMDEVFTKLVDKFLETNTAPKPDKGGGMPPALASGVGAGMSAGQKLASGLGGKPGDATSPTGGGKPGGKTASTNAGGLNGQQGLPASGQKRELGSGGPAGGDDGAVTSGKSLRALPGGGPEDARAADGGDQPSDHSAPLQLTGGRTGSSHAAKETAQSLSGMGGLSNLGYSTGREKVGFGGKGGSAPVEMAEGPDGVFRPISSSSGVASGSRPGGRDNSGTGKASGIGSDAPTSPSGGRKSLAGTSDTTRFGTGPQGAPHGADGTGEAASRFGGGAIASPTIYKDQHPQGTGSAQEVTGGSQRRVLAPAQTPVQASPGLDGAARQVAVGQGGANQAQQVAAQSRYGAPAQSGQRQVTPALARSSGNGRGAQRTAPKHSAPVQSTASAPASAPKRQQRTSSPASAPLQAATKGPTVESVPSGRRTRLRPSREGWRESAVPPPKTNDPGNNSEKE